MFESAYEIAKELDIDIEDSIYENPNVSHVLFLELEIKEDNSIEHSIEVVEYDEQKHLKSTPYQKPPASGPGGVPTVRLNLDKIGSTLTRKIIGWFDKRKKDSSALLQPIFITLSEFYKVSRGESNPNLQKLIEDIKERTDNQNTYLVTVRFIDKGLDQNFSQYIQSNLMSSATASFSEKYDTVSRGTSTCYYCGEEKTVNGFASPETFYTHDKTTFSPGFDKSEAWKIFPVCDECELLVEEGMRFIKKNLSFNLHGVFYLLFPKAFYSEDLESLIERLKEAHLDPERTAETDKNQVTIRDELFGNEDEVYEELGENNVLTLTFLFYQLNNSQFEILSLVNNVLPSRIAELFKAKKIVENRAFNTGWYDSLTKESSLRFSYYNLRQLFPKSPVGEGGNSDIFKKEFIELVAASFRGDSLQQTKIINQGNRMIRHLFVNRGDLNDNFLYMTLTVYMVLEFYKEIGCIQKGEIQKMDIEKELTNFGLSSSKLARKSLEIFNENEYFDHPYKKGVFILGILTKQIANQQYKRLKSTPFYEKLQGLRFSPRVVERLFPEAINKLIEYNANKFEVSSLETLASKYFLENTDYPSNETISFTFAMGLSFGNAIWANYNVETDNEVKEDE